MKQAVDAGQAKLDFDQKYNTVILEAKQGILEQHQQIQTARMLKATAAITSPSSLRNTTSPSSLRTPSTPSPLSASKTSLSPLKQENGEEQVEGSLSEKFNQLDL